MITDVRPAGKGPTRNALTGPLVAVAATVVIAVTAVLSGARFGEVFLVVVLTLALGVWLLSNPVAAVIALLLALFLRVPLTNVFPVDPFVPIFAAVIGAFVLWMSRTPDRLRGVGPVEWLMGLYLLWNIFSVFAPHMYEAVDTITGEPVSLPRFIMTGTLMPFALYVVGRYAFDRERKVVGLLWGLLAISAYSAAVSIMQFTGPANLVWPRYIVEEDDVESWVGRASGVMDQPVSNGMILALGIVIAVVLIARRDEPRWRRGLALVIAPACGIALYLTYTRAAWLSGLVVLILGAVLAKGYRKGFVAALALVFAVVAANWSVFISADRLSGGVGSVGEIQDRLNTLQTALWAAAEKPLAGWGLARYQSVNTYHHQQWSPEVPWERGYGIASHWNEMGILAELGVIGLLLWVAVLVLVVHRLVRAYRVLPDDRTICGRPLAVIAIVAMGILLMSGLTVDLRLLDLPTAAIFLLAGVAVGWADRTEQRSDVPAVPARDHV